MEAPNRRDLTDLLDRVAAAAARAERVSVGDLFAELGDRSVIPLILVISVILISPISGVPGVPTISACLIVLLSLQALGGRRRIWLPDFLLRRTLSGRRLRMVVDWLRKPCGFVDRQTRPRLPFMTTGVMRFVTLSACVFIPLGWPPLEVLPLTSSVGALTVAMLVYGLFTRDGLYVLAGYGLIALTVAGAAFILL